MDGRWWRRRLAAFGGAWLLAAVFAGAAIERAYAQATPKPAPTAPKPSKFPLTEEEKRQQAHQETFKAFERLKRAYEGKCEVVEIYPQFLKISRARDEFDAAVKKEAETSAEVEKARAELREREADAEAAKKKELSVPVEYQRAADQRVVEAKLKLDKAREEAGQRILREYQTDLEALERARCPLKHKAWFRRELPA